MSIALASATVWPDHVAVADDPEILEEVRSREINLALWRRPCPGSPRSFGACDLTTLEPLAEICAPEAVGEAVQEATCALDREIGEVLVEDAGRLARLFADATGAARVECRLEHVTTDACRRFHADYVRYRLLTTYRGEGTQWLAGADAARLAAGETADSLSPYQLAAGDVGIFKGRLASETPIVHRSPPIVATGTDRLLLVISTVTESDRAF